MREVKYRAWDKVNKEMHVDIQEADGTHDHITYNTDESMVKLHIDSFSDYLHDDDFIIIQYTGLKDEKGIDVFEKDIVNIVELGKNILEYVSVVEYENSGYLVTEPNGTQVPLDCFHNQENAVMPLFEIEVIGNAFENPDLLEGEK